MSVKRESTRVVPSVMARLMGLDETPTLQPVHRRGRVLSENYLCRVSSIGVREKCSEQQSLNFNMEKQDEYDNVLQVIETLRRKKHRSKPVAYRDVNFASLDVHSNLQSGHGAILNSPPDPSCGDISKYRKFRRKIELRNLNSTKKVRTGIGVSDSGDRVKNEILFSFNRNIYVEKKERKSMPNGPGPFRPRFRFLKDRTKIAGHRKTSMPNAEPRSELGGSDHFTKESELTVASSPTLSGRKRQVNSSGASYMTGEAKKRVSERCKITEKSQQNELPGSWTNEFIRGLPRPRSLLTCFDAVGSPNIVEVDAENGGYNSILPEFSMQSSFSISVDVDAKYLSNYEKHELESSNCIFPEKEEDSSSYIQYAKEISDGTFEEESDSSQCSCTDPDCMMNSFEEAYQASPNSVLERFCKKGISSTSGCFKSVHASLHDVKVQLELLKAETSEAYAEGSSMVVSSDDDNEEGSVNSSEENQGLIHPFRVEKSQDFSYLVDVLTEAGFQNRFLTGDVQFQEFPVSDSVFEILEKKYGEQISWKRTERRLLFDRINLSLMEILQQFKGAPTWTKPMVRRFVLSQGGLVKEELWMLLVRQEKELSKESEKFLGKDDGWMELGDDIEIIGREIENSLIDELVAEVSSEIFC